MGAPWLPRAFYESRFTVPSSRRWLESHIEGHHIYGTNASGRSRFEVFPEEGQIMEDAFFDRMYDRDEKLAVEGAQVTVPLPPSGRALLRGMTRVYQGNWELDSWLLTHRPDRVPTPAPRSHESRAHAAWRTVRPGGENFASWRPRTVLVALTSLALRNIAIRRARRLVREGRQADWR